MRSPHKPINNSFFLCFSFVGFTDPKPCRLLELGVLGAHPLGGRFKS